MSSETTGAHLLNPNAPEDRRVLDDLRADPRIEFVDTVAEQAAALAELRPAPGAELLAEPQVWAYYPWRRAVVRLLGRRAFDTVRLNRNRNQITADEQARLRELRVGVVGLSVGHVIAHTLAAEGVCGRLRLADFDALELSNLNRVPATVFDLSVNKAVVAARRIAEVDPYLDVEVLADGVAPESVDRFLDGLDVLVEECDSLDMKLVLREAARRKGIAVLMTTSDRGLTDVERYDLDPTRPILHGLLGDLDASALAGLSSRDKVPYVLRILDGAQLSARTAASLVEIGETLSTWPQLAGEVTAGASAVAEAVRRIGLGEELPSGRVRIDVAEALLTPEVSAPPPRAHPAPQDDPPETGQPSGLVLAAAMRAPSGGNAQPWRVRITPDALRLSLAPEHSSTMDVNYRASAVAVGAAVFNARVAAAAHRILGPVTFGEDDGAPLSATVSLSDGTDSGLAALYGPMLRRETNRKRGVPTAIPDATVDALTAAATREGGRVALLLARDEISEAADVLAETDRIRYLTPRLHTEMFSELRFPGDAMPDSGIDVRSLELDPADLVKLDILRRPEVMAHLADWDAGAALGDGTREHVGASAGLAVICVPGTRLTDYACGGSVAEAVWIVAQQHGLAVQPVSPVFLYAHTDAELSELSMPFSSALQALQAKFRTLAHTKDGESQVLILRFSDAPPATVRSRRSLGRIDAPATSQSTWG